MFLAAEQGAGKHAQHANMVINPKVRMQPKRWLLEGHPLLALKDLTLKDDQMQDLETSTQVDSRSVDGKHNEELKEFLRPTFEQATSKKIKILEKC